MDLVKFWGNLIAANALNRSTMTMEGFAVQPTAYFMQGVHLFASETGLNGLNTLNSLNSPLSSGASLVSSSVRSDISEATLSETDSDIETDEKYAQDVKDIEDLSKCEDQASSSVKHTRRRIQRTRYSREEYKCKTCAYTCTTEKAFFKHLRQDCEKSTNVEGYPRISCPICGKDRDSEPLLLAHMVKHRAGKHFCCDLCKFRTLQMKKLIQHRRMHTGEKPHLCPYCTYRSARRDNLRSHVRRVHKKDNLTCDTFAPRTMVLRPRAAAARTFETATAVVRV